MAEMDIIRELEALRRQVNAMAQEKPGLWLNFVNRDALPPLSANGSAFTAGVPWSTIYPVKFRVYAYVITTNNATNYWTIKMLTAVTNPAASVSTQSLAPNIWNKIDSITFTNAPYTDTVDKTIDIAVTKTLSPGNMYLVPMLYVYY